MKKLRKIRRKLPYNKKNRQLVFIGLAVVIGLLAFYILRPSKMMVRSSAPKFSALVPDGKQPDWQQSKPQGGSSSSAVYIYTDKIEDVPIKVSQQPLPASFLNDPDAKVAEVAEGFNATDSMQVNGMFVYIGTSTKGPQSVIFSNGSLLILIKSDSVIATGAWADYISTLKKT